MTQEQLVRALRKLADILETATGLVIYRYEIKLAHPEPYEVVTEDARRQRCISTPIHLDVDIQASLQSYELHESDTLHPSADH